MTEAKASVVDALLSSAEGEVFLRLWGAQAALFFLLNLSCLLLCVRQAIYRMPIPRQE